MKMKTCRICLVMDVKMFSLGNTEVKDFIERIFNLYGYNQSLNALHYACFECRALLEKTFKFIQRVLTAQQVLHNMLKKKKKIYQPDLRKLDRLELGLNTNLRKHLCTVDFYINEETSDDKSSKININKVSEHMFNSNNGTEIKEDENTKVNPHTALITEGGDILHENKCFIEIKSEPFPDPFANVIVLDSDDEGSMTNGVPKSNSHTVPRKKNTTEINQYSQSCTVKTNDTENRSNIVCLNKEKHDGSSCNETNSVIKDIAIPNTEIMKRNIESECYIDIKIEEFPDPLLSTTASANLTSLESKCDLITGSIEKHVSPDHYSCTIKPCDTEINCDMVYNIGDKNQGEGFSNMKRKLHTSVKNVDDDWRPGFKPIKQKKRKYLNKQRTHVKKKPNMKIKSIASTNSAQSKTVDDILINTKRRNNVNFVNDHFDNSEEESNKKEKGKKEDDDYQPATSSGESEDSMYDRYNDDGRRLKKPEEREYPRKCDHCNFEVPVKREHFIHYVRFHKDVEYPYGQKSTYVCQFCGRLSKTFRHHITHELSHGEKTVECTVCPKKFTSRARMRAHLNTVHYAKILECDYCGKTSKTRSDLELHIRIHTGVKPYKCHICGAGFAHGGNRTIHIRTNHQQSIEYQKNKKRRKRKYQYTSSDTDTIVEAIDNQQKKKSKGIRKDKKNTKKPSGKKPIGTN